MVNKKSIVFVAGKGLTKFSGYYFRIKKEIDLILHHGGYDVKLIGLVTNNVKNEKYLQRVKKEMSENSHFLSFRNIIKLRHHIKKSDLLHLENPMAFFFSWFSLFFIKKKPKLLFDYHGASPEENRALGGNIISFSIVKFWEWLGIMKSDAIILVSNTHRDYLLEKFKISSNKIFVIRNFIEDNLVKVASKNKHSLRKQLGLPLDITIVVYSGNFQSWQEPELIELIADYLSQANNGTLFLLLSGDPKAKAIANNKTIIHKSLDREEVFLYLKAADVGLLLRRPNKINHFADPTKLAEYLSSGLTIFSSGLGDLERMILQNPLIGFYSSKSLDAPNEVLQEFIDFMSNFKNERTNEESIKLYQQEYTSKTARDKLFDCYERIFVS